LAAGFCPKNLAFARKIMVLPESGELQHPAPWLVRLCRPTCIIMTIITSVR